MATTNTTQSIISRGGLLPVLRSGNFAGQGYAGRLGAETMIEDPSINAGQPILASALTQTQQGLAQFMQLALKTEPNGYIDGVTRNHDVEYTVAEIRFMDKVQTQFGGKLPYELTVQDKLEPAYKQLESARNGEYWQADQRMLTSMAQYQPTDYVDATYRNLLVSAFYTKAESATFGYGLGQEASDFYKTLQTIDANISIPTLGDSLGAWGSANALARADFESLATLPITAQERQFFNPQLKVGQYLDTSTNNPDGSLIGYDTKDSTNRIVVPEKISDNVYAVRTQMGGDTVTMILDKTDKDSPVFTKEIKHNGEVVSTETIRPTDQVRESEVAARAYQSITTDGAGNVVDTQVIAKPNVPSAEIPEDLQQKIDAVKSGDYSKVVGPGIDPHSSTPDPFADALLRICLATAKSSLMRLPI